MNPEEYYINRIFVAYNEVCTYLLNKFDILRKQGKYIKCIAELDDHINVDHFDVNHNVVVFRISQRKEDEIYFKTIPLPELLK